MRRGDRDAVERKEEDDRRILLAESLASFAAV